MRLLNLKQCVNATVNEPVTTFYQSVYMFGLVFMIYTKCLLCDQHMVNLSVLSSTEGVLEFHWGKKKAHLTFFGVNSTPNYIVHSLFC